MTKEYYTISNHYRNYKTDHSTYGGKIYLSDFDTSHPSEHVVQNIVSGWAFDRACKQNIKNRDRNNNFTNGKDLKNE
jgi:hypothetical protein